MLSPTGPAGSPLPLASTVFGEMTEVSPGRPPAGRCALGDPLRRHPPVSGQDRDVDGGPSARPRFTASSNSSGGASATFVSGRGL